MTQMGIWTMCRHQEKGEKWREKRAVQGVVYVLVHVLEPAMEDVLGVVVMLLVRMLLLVTAVTVWLTSVVKVLET